MSEKVVVIVRGSWLAAKALRSASNRFLGFWDSKQGVTAVEFGIISAPLLGLLFGIFQNSFAFYMQQGLRVAVDGAARQMMTGEVQNNPAIVDGTSFRDQLICNKNILPSFVTCANVVVDVRASSDGTFASLGANDANSSFMPSGAQYTSGQPCQIMVVRAAYPMPSFLPLISWAGKYTLVTNLTGLTTYKGKLVKMLSAAAVARNEPYAASSYCSP